MSVLASSILAPALSAMGLFGSTPAGAPVAIDAPDGTGATLFGSALTAVGDLDGDGFGDFVIASPDAAGPADPDIGEGVCYFIRGGPDVLADPVVAVTLAGDQPGMRFGAAVCGAGDVDGDGFGDLAVTATKYSNGQTNEGLVQIFRGSPTGPLSTPFWSFEANAANVEIGSLLVPLGDVNRDGYADLGLADVAVVQACAFYGSPTGLAPVPDWVFVVAGQGQGGMTAVGDVNDDGYDDILVAGFDAGGSGTAKAYFFRGGPNGLQAGPSGAFIGAAGCSGLRLAPGGDLDSDGAPDALIGDTCTDQLKPYFGNGKVLKPGAVIGKPLLANDFPVLLAGGHDRDADGFDDVVVADPDSSYAWVYRGAATGLAVDPATQIGAPVIGHAPPSPTFAASLAFAGDIDLDGDSELLIGDPSADSTLIPGPDAGGRVYLYSGAPIHDSTGPTVRLGDRIEGQLLVATAPRFVNFDALKGTVVTLAFDAAPGQRVRVSLVAPSGVDESGFVVQLGAVTTTKTVKVKQSGRYALGFEIEEGLDMQLGVVTAETLPAKAQASTTVVNLTSGSALSKFDVLALPGATIDVTFAPKKPLSVLQPGIASPFGSVLPSDSYATGDGAGLVLDDVPVFACGKHRITAQTLFTGAKTKLTVTITPQQPATGTAVISLD